jgi:hypothetical protein
VQATALKNATRERDNLKDSIVDARVLNQTHKGQLEALRVEGESIKERLRVVTEERDSSRLELDKIQGQHWELRDLVASDAERLRAVERELERARSEADRCVFLRPHADYFEFSLFIFNFNFFNLYSMLVLSRFLFLDDRRSGSES